MNEGTEIWMTLWIEWTVTIILVKSKNIYQLFRLSHLMITEVICLTDNIKCEWIRQCLAQSGQLSRARWKKFALSLGMRWMFVRTCVCVCVSCMYRNFLDNLSCELSFALIQFHMRTSVYEFVYGIGAVL